MFVRFEIDNLTLTRIREILMSTREEAVQINVRLGRHLYIGGYTTKSKMEGLRPGDTFEAEIWLQYPHHEGLNDCKIQTLLIEVMSTNEVRTKIYNDST